MAIKLNQSNRASIIDKAMSVAFGHVDSAYEAKRVVVANRLYDHAFPADVVKRASALPVEWIAKADHLTLSRRGFRDRWETCDSKPNRELRFGKSRPWPNFVGDIFKIGDEHPLCADVDELVVACREIWGAKQQFKSNLTNLLHSVSTVEKLRQVWPEGEPYFPKPAPVVALPVPADLAAKVNAMLTVVTI